MSTTFYDFTIKAIEDVPGSELHKKKLRQWVDGHTWFSERQLLTLAWHTINEPYCFRVYMHYAMLLSKVCPNDDRYKKLFENALGRYNEKDFAPTIRAEAKHRFYVRQYIRLYGGSKDLFN